MRVDLIGQDYEGEISEILLMVDSGLGVTVGIILCTYTETSRQVGCGCTVCSFTTLGECELSLS